MHVIYWPEELLLNALQGKEGMISNYFADGRCLREDFWIIFGFSEHHSLDSIGQLTLEGKCNLEESSIVTFVIPNDFTVPIEIYRGKSLLRQVKIVLYSVPRAKLFEFYAFPPVEPIAGEILTPLKSQFTANCIRSEIGFSVIDVLNCHFGVAFPQKPLNFLRETNFYGSSLVRNLQFKALALTKTPNWSIESVNLAFFLLVDIFLGLALTFLISNRIPELEFHFSNIRSQCTVETYKNLMNWLMGWPAGFKLNNNLNKFLGEMFLWMFSLWERLAYSLLYSLDSTCITCAFLASTLGISTFFACLQDTLRLVTLHLQFMHFVSCKIYKSQVFCLFNLLLLFRGMKWNDLRKRYDYADYETEQLLIGTVLFTVLAYLFPTVLVYFVSFYLTQMVISFANNLLVFCQFFFIHFPYWQWICKVFARPNSIPYTIAFEKLSNTNEIEYFRLKNIPLSVWQILTNHISLAISVCQIQK